MKKKPVKGSAREKPASQGAPRKTRPEKVPSSEFALDMLDASAESAAPAPDVQKTLNRAIKQIREGAPAVIVKGQTERQCQVQLVPLFVEKANKAGLKVEEVAAGRLRVGKSDVFFEPLYLVRQAKGAAKKRKTTRRKLR